MFVNESFFNVSLNVLRPSDIMYSVLGYFGVADVMRVSSLKRGWSCQPYARNPFHRW